LTALRAALEERSREQSPYQWARTQVNIGLTLLTLSRRGGGNKVAHAAITAFKEALSGRPMPGGISRWSKAFPPKIEH